jgi:hypothetical protein
MHLAFYVPVKNTGKPVDQITYRPVYGTPAYGYNFVLSLSKSLNMKTLKHLSLSVLVLALILVLQSGCKKDKDNNNNSNRNVKYELSGSYTGKFTVIISDNESGTQTYNNVSIPWSKEVSYSSKVIAIGIGTTVTTYGGVGQNAFLKIYSGGNVLKSTNATSDNDGVLSLPTLGHNF